jgi:diphosphomevalonate decarboxylase
MKSRSKAIAYPGLPLVFAEGFRDFKSRLSSHSHASLAVTDAYETVKTETAVETSKVGVQFSLNGRVSDDPRTASVHNLIREMVSLATDETGVIVESMNHGVLTGSSDSGAAALVTALDDMLELNLPLWRMIELARQVSETAYRSLIGGLSEYLIDDQGNVRTVEVKKARFFKDVMIYAVPFDIKRFAADDLHKRVTQHPQYTNRSIQVDVRLAKLQELVDDRNIIGILELMESEAKVVHMMFSDMGMGVIKPEMKAVLDLVAEMRSKGVRAYWNVAGGSTVYVFTLKRWAKDVTRYLKDNNFKYKHFKVADGAKVV